VEVGRIRFAATKHGLSVIICTAKVQGIKIQNQELGKYHLLINWLNCAQGKTAKSLTMMM
jgi:hypothetical protein